jgi:group I intron endonuclease
MIIYKTTNLINGKFYVGQDSKNDPDYLGSGVLIKKAIEKYGRENFKKEVLEQCITKEKLDERETYWIDVFNSTNLEIGYNILKIGNSSLGYKHVDETKKKMKESRRGRKLSESHKKNISKSSIGRKVSEITRQKISKKLKGITRTEEHILKISQANKGKIRSEAHKNAIRLANIGRIKSDEELAKIIKAHSKMILQYDLDGKFIKEWESAIEIKRKLNIGHVIICCKGKRKQSGGFIWKYKNIKN